ncbi:MAG: hypothetical protein HY720_01580 [Planctomycetes bacterium]|nr:hypothetical protein [Planctomycetota bacterium]
MTPWVEKTEGVVLRRIDLVRHGSAASEQAEREFALSVIPTTRVYDGQGRFLGDVLGPDFPAIQALARRDLP